MVYKIVFAIYQVLRATRYTVLHSIFGFTIHCKHSPTCGTRLLNIIKKKQYNQLPTVIRQIITCW